jgi:predicted HicB family RNase H-like nuclease
MAGKKNVGGRPPRAGVPSTKKLWLRLTPAEHEELQRLAKAEGLSVSEFVRKWALAVKGAAQEGLLGDSRRK